MQPPRAPANLGRNLHRAAGAFVDLVRVDDALLHKINVLLRRGVDHLFGDLSSGRYQSHDTKRPLHFVGDRFLADGNWNAEDIGGKLVPELIELLLLGAVDEGAALDDLDEDV